MSALRTKRAQLQERQGSAPAGSASPQPGCLKEAATKAAQQAVEAHMKGLQDALSAATEQLGSLVARLEAVQGQADKLGDELAILRRRQADHERGVDTLIECQKARMDGVDTRLEELSSDAAIMSEILTA